MSPSKSDWPQSYPLECKGKFWLEPVKGKMNSPPAHVRPFAALDRTYPKLETAFEEVKECSGRLLYLYSNLADKKEGAHDSISAIYLRI